MLHQDDGGAVIDTEGWPTVKRYARTSFGNADSAFKDAEYASAFTRFDDAPSATERLKDALYWIAGFALIFAIGAWAWRQG